MELESLRTFIQAVRLGSLTAAAHAMARTQPAITMQIKRLEQEAGERLLLRVPRGVRPTRAGEILYARAQVLLRDADDLLAEVRAVGSLRTGALRIGATDVMALGYLPRVLKAFRERYPGIQTAVEVEGSRALGDRVAKSELDLALVTLPLENPVLEFTLVHREPVVFVAEPHYAAVGRRLSLTDLAREPMIHHKRDSVTREEVAAVFRVQGLEPNVAMEVSSPEAIKELVALGLGIAPLSRSQVEADCQAGRLVRLRTPEFRCWRRSGLIHLRGAKQSRVVAAFIGFLPKMRPGTQR